MSSQICKSCATLKTELYYLTREIKKLKVIIEAYKQTGTVYIWED